MQAPDWDDPLPHALQPSLAYLSRPTAQTRAAVVLLHGRGDNAADFADAFLPALHRCFGGAPERLEEGEAGGSSDVAVLSLAAADGIWYPESHSVTAPEQLEYNGPYVYSALQRLQQTLLDLAASGVPPSRVVVAGFSQGANLANTYLLCALREQHRELPRPACVLALAGTRLASLPPFPLRAGTYADSEAARRAPPSSAVHGAEETFVRLICGEGDRYFRPAEIHTVAAELAASGVRVSVALEPGVGHIVTPRMVAAVIEAAQQLCARP